MICYKLFAYFEALEPTRQFFLNRASLKLAILYEMLKDQREEVNKDGPKVALNCKPLGPIISELQALVQVWLSLFDL